MFNKYYINIFKSNIYTNANNKYYIYVSGKKQKEKYRDNTKYIYKFMYFINIY